MGGDWDSIAALPGTYPHAAHVHASTASGVVSSVASYAPHSALAYETRVRAMARPVADVLVEI